MTSRRKSTSSNGDTLYPLSPQASNSSPGHSRSSSTSGHSRSPSASGHSRSPSGHSRTPSRSSSPAPAMTLSSTLSDSLLHPPSPMKRRKSSGNGRSLSFPRSSSMPSTHLSLDDNLDDSEMGPLEEDSPIHEPVKPPLLGWYGVAMVALTLSLFSLILNLYVELMNHSASHALVNTATSATSIPAITISVAALFVTVPLTHGLAGSRRYGSRLYTFWQPFVGGFRFVFLQFIGWLAWATSMLVGVYVLWVGTKQVASGLLATMGIGGLIGQVAVLASLQFFTSSQHPSVEEAHDEIEEEVISASAIPREPIMIKTPAQRAEETRRRKHQPLLGWYGVGYVGVLLTLLSFVLAMILESMKLSLVSHLSITTLATSAILIAVPLTHVLAGRRMDKQYQLFQPFRGGTKFVTLQALGWALWTIAILSAFFAIYLGSQDIHISGVITSAGVGGVLAQSFVFLSLRYFDAQITASVCLASNKRKSIRQISTKEIQHVQSLIIESHSTSEPPLTLSRSRTVPLKRAYSIAHMHLTDASGIRYEFNLHEIADVMMHLDGDLLERILEQSRFQLTTRSHHQAYSRISVYLTHTIPSEKPIYIQSVTGVSWQTWKHGVAEHWDTLKSINWYEKYLDARGFLIIIILYSLPMAGTFIFFSPFFLLYITGAPWWACIIAISQIAFYFYHYRKRHYVTGIKSWEFVRTCIWLWGAFERYFDATIIPVGKLDPTKKYLYGFHPHGIYPMTCFWATRGPTFRKLYPGCEMDILGATIMFFAPLLREMLLWAGGRDVSRASIKHALSAGRSILLIPGGQREMRMSTFGRDELHLVTAHHGFVKQALEHGADLVPVLSLGETQILFNIHAPHMQSFTTKYVGFGFPMFPYGRWYSPFPSPTKITVIVGEPISVPQTSSPTPELVHEIHTKYYAQISQLFHAYREQAGYPNCQLIFTKGI